MSIRPATMIWTKTADALPPLGVRFVGWHETDGLVVSGRFTGSWDDDTMRASMVGHRITHWMLVPPPDGEEEK